MPHLVLLGDSIFDNGAYVGHGPALIDQVRSCLPSDARATLAAMDGSVASDVARQLARLSDRPTHLVVSVGGNDLLAIADILAARVADVGEAMLLLGDAAEAFESGYRAMLRAVVRAGLPTAVCTVYYPRFPEAVMQRMSITALTAFNDVIVRAAADAGIPVLDLRRICTDESDYANEIEPSSAGGEKIAGAIVRLLQAGDEAWRRPEIRV